MMTEIYKTGPAELASYIMKLWCRRNWWIMAILPVTCLVLAAVVDVKFLLIALMMVFVVLPPMMIFVYFYHALAPEARMTVLPHRAEMTDDGIRLIYEPLDEEVPPRPDDNIRWSQISGVKATSQFLAYHLTTGRYSIFLVPRSAFKTIKEYGAWVALQNSYLINH